jgi:hypothetical protein
VRISLRLSPPTARVLLDGVLRRENPLLLEASERRRRLRVEAEGHLPAEQDLVPRESHTIHVALLAVAPANRRPGGRRVAPGKAPKKPDKAPETRPEQKDFLFDRL